MMAPSVANASLHLEHLGLEPDVVHVEYVTAHHRPVVTAQPPYRSGPRDTERSDNVHIPSDPNQFSKAMVVRALRSLL